MGYSKTQWNSGREPEISATLLNKMEQGIYDAQHKSVHYTEDDVTEFDVPLNADRLDGHPASYFAQATALEALSVEVGRNSAVRHSHDNKSVLDIITQAMVDAIGTIAQKYVKPLTGIPKSDLATGVQNSLSRADDAIVDSDYVHTDNNYSDVEKAKLNAKYEKPVNGIPRTDLSGDVVISLSNADSALQQSALVPYRTSSAQDVIDSAITGRVGAIEGKESGWDAKYNKPSGGIPKTDLAQEVKNSLAKADSALQVYNIRYIVEEEEE